MSRNHRQNQSSTESQTPQSSPRSETEAVNRQGSLDEADIAQRAYRRFEERGYEHGHDVDDWLQAERDGSQPTTSVEE
jgi:hypothetical protein